MLGVILLERKEKMKSMLFLSGNVLPHENGIELKTDWRFAI